MFIFSFRVFFLLRASAPFFLSQCVRLRQGVTCRARGRISERRRGQSKTLLSRDNRAVFHAGSMGPHRCRFRPPATRCTRSPSRGLNSRTDCLDPTTTDMSPPPAFTPRAARKKGQRIDRFRDVRVFIKGVVVAGKGEGGGLARACAGDEARPHGPVLGDCSPLGVAGS